ncbi:Dihydropteroate synthase [hydrothermal vent metagenome]|uniref:dihydropteroate synthase n=1 Tax=hydrothermal vent metagenome TaxID=652676 RepID=A0A3B0VZH1_9ZZZZ
MFSIKTFIQEKVERNRGMPVVMGILNVTPDSFSDGGRFVTSSAIEKQVLAMLDGGVDIIDVGGESTRPGAKKVALPDELERVLPVIDWITQRFETVVSVDTYKTEVMREAVKCGASLINDVNALQAKDAISVAVDTGVSVCLMHKQGEPMTMQNAPFYQDILVDVKAFLLERARCCEAQGMTKDKIILDPGFGFGKTLAHNEVLFQNLEALTSLNYPVLVGVSRKRMIAEILNESSALNLMVGSVAAAVLAVLKGANIVRVHDVKETVDALKVTMRLRSS